jgi:LuxR family maltose regulon positive regulatory protein
LRNGDFVAARAFFYQCGDFEEILSSMEEETAKLFTPEHKDVLKKYVEECPEEIKKRHPYALFVLAIHLFTHQDLKPFDQICREIENNLQTDESLDEAQKTQLRGELELLYGGLKYNDLKKMSAHFKKAWALLGRPTAIFRDLSDWNMGSPSILCLYHRESGKLEEEVSDMLANMECYDRLSGGHASGGEYLMEAERYFNRGDFENAEISLHKAVNRARTAGNSSILLCTMFLQIRLAFIRGDAGAAVAILENMRRQVAETSEYHALQMVELCKMAFHAYLERTVDLPEILDPAEGQGIKLRFFTLPVFHIVYGRILLGGGEYLKLIGSADQFLSVAAFFPNLMGSIYTYIYLAAANYRIFREKDAMDSLQKALDLALPDQLYMPFVENCDYIAPLLRDCSGQGRFQAEIEKILALYDIYAPLKEALIRDHLSGGRPALTDRELKVARLVAEGLTNQEIARRLYISVNTVKASLKAIYAKLSINNRMHLKVYIDRLSGDA